MGRAVSTGGFGNGPENAERVAKGLLKYYDDVDPFTFSYAMDNPDVIRGRLRAWMRIRIL